MRKVQSSVQLMERSRNPGVGYWSSTANGLGASSSSPAVPPPPSRSGVTSPDSVSVVGTPTRESRRSLESFDTRASPAPGTATPSEAQKSSAGNEEEEVNLEVSTAGDTIISGGTLMKNQYLRNVILQFLEHKEMRPNLVRVLSVILRFTPQELRRLNAKLLT